MKAERILASLAVSIAITMGAFAPVAAARPTDPLEAFRGDEFSAVARSGNKIIAAGTAQSCRWSGDGCQHSSAPRAPLVARFTNSGKLDRRFNGGGVRLLDEETRYTRIIGIVVRSDRSVVIGYATKDGCCKLVSLTRSGKLNPSFGEDGRAAVPGSLFNASGSHGMAVLGDGRVVIAGQVNRYPDPGEFGVLAIEANGEIDSNFGDEGIATVGPPVGPLDGYSGDVAIQRGRGILALGSTDPSPEVHALTAVRFKFDGSLDIGFGTSGVTRFAEISDNIIGLAAGAIIPFGPEGIAAACDLHGINSMDPNGQESGTLFEAEANEELIGCIDLADAAKVDSGIVVAGASSDEHGDGLPHPWIWQYERTQTGKLGPPKARSSLPRSFLGFNNGVTSYGGGFVVAGSLLSGRCRPPWLPGSRCEVAAVTRLTDSGRDLNFGHGGVATLHGGPICAEPERRQCR